MHLILIDKMIDHSTAFCIEEKEAPVCPQTVIHFIQMIKSLMKQKRNYILSRFYKTTECYRLKKLFQVYDLEIVRRDK